MNQTKNAFDYDIRTSRNALATLTTLTGVPRCVWYDYQKLSSSFQFTDDLIYDAVTKHGNFPDRYQDFNFIFFHITTSANECINFQKFGVLDLINSYNCNSSELRIFLDERNIHIDTDNHILKYHEQSYDISFGSCPKIGTEAYKRWAIGRKFSFDYNTCGFLSIWDRSSYLGRVHHRPELLENIDDLLGLRLSKDWMNTHKPYEVIAYMNGQDIEYDGFDEDTDQEKIIHYMVRAYWNAFSEPTENIVLIKRTIQIPPQNIISIEPFEQWIDC